MDGRGFDVIDPATETATATISLPGSRDVDRAVQAARDAFPDYATTTVEQRLSWLGRLLDIHRLHRLLTVGVIPHILHAQRSQHGLDQRSHARACRG